MEALQNLLTVAIEFVAIAGFGGIALHAIWSSHCRWMAAYCPAIHTPDTQVEVEPKPQQESIAELVATEPQQEPVATEELFATEVPVVESVVKPDPTKYEFMSVKQLRLECQIRCIDWRRSGDYGKAMRKNQMIRALTA